MDLLNIVRPTFPPLETFRARFSACLDRGQVTNNGPYVCEFEDALTEYLGVPTLCFSSGQAALLAMLGAGEQQGEVICPAFTFAATPHAVATHGYIPVFADIDPHTLCLDPEDVARRVTRHTTAILAVDPYGICCNHEALRVVADRFKLGLFIDSAAAFGSEVTGRVTGGFSDAQIFSFHATKPFSTMEGGCLCSHDAGLMIRAKEIRNFGQSSDGEVECVGFNGKMLEVCALIGLEQLKVWPETIYRRRINASLLRQALLPIEKKVSVHPPSGQNPSWLYQPILLDADIDRDGFVDRLAQAGVAARKYYSPGCHRMAPYLSPCVKLPVTEAMAGQVVSLPVYNDMKLCEIDAISKAVAGALR